MKNPLSGVLLIDSVEEQSLCHAATPLGVETRLTENRASAFLDWSRLERNLALRAALAANGVVHLAILHALVLACRTTVLAPLGRRELLGRVELLLTIGEHEALAAVATGDLLISHKTRKKEIRSGNLPVRAISFFPFLACPP